MSEGKKKGTSRAAIIMLIVIAVILAIFSAYIIYIVITNASPFWTQPQSSQSPQTSLSVSPTTTPFPSALSSQSPSPSSTPLPTLPVLTSSPIPFGNVATYNALVNDALSLINTDRQQNGLQNVTLSNVNSAQLHADEMLANDYISHWDTNGFKPYMRYTLAGGTGAVQENCIWQGETANLSPIDVNTTLKEMESSMMNNDAASNWDHRNNILNPLHNEVSIGIAYDDHNVYLVQDFENDYISWNVLNLGMNQTTLEGTINTQNSTIKQIAVFYDNVSPLTPDQLRQSPYTDGYDAGTLVGLVLPPNWQANEGITITAGKWVQNGNSFQIAFSLSQALATYGKGVYTLYIETGTSTADSLLTNSIWVN